MNKPTAIEKRIDQQLGRFRIQFDFDYTGAEHRQMSDEVVTQPDMSLTVRQLLENHTRGLDSNVQHKEPLYFDVPVPVITDITDVYEYRQSLEKRIAQVQDFIQQELDEEEQKKQEQQLLENAVENPQPEKPLEKVVLGSENGKDTPLP